MCIVVLKLKSGIINLSRFQLCFNSFSNFSFSEPLPQYADLISQPDTGKMPPSPIQAYNETGDAEHANEMARLASFDAGKAWDTQ